MDHAPLSPGPATHPAHVGGGSESAPLSLSPRVVWFWRVPWLVVAAIFVVIALITLVATDSAAVASLGWAMVGVPFAVVALLVPSARYRRWRYWVTEDGVELRHGLVFRTESSIPHFRVQHIDVRQGPVQRLAGVVELVISTASAATDATLPGLAPERAEHIRHMVLARAEADDAV